MSAMVNPFMFGVSITEVVDGYLGVTSGTTQYNAGGDEKNVIPITVPVGGVYARRLQLGLYSAGAGHKLRSIVYSSSSSLPSALVKDGQELVLSGTEAGTVVDLWLNADHSEVFFPAGDYWIGAHGNNGATDFQCIGSGPGTRYIIDGYFDGASDPFGTGSTFGSYIRCAMPYRNP